MCQLKKTSFDNTNNYNNHHGDYFLTMSLRINTENAKYAWCAVKRHKSYWSVYILQYTYYCVSPFRYIKFVFLQGLK
jgi:hypothetical protein